VAKGYDETKRIAASLQLSQLPLKNHIRRGHEHICMPAAGHQAVMLFEQRTVPDRVTPVFALQSRFIGCPARRPSSESLRGIHWLRILLGGFLAEVFCDCARHPVSLLFGITNHPSTALFGSLLGCFLFALWVALAAFEFALHPCTAILVGLVATLIYVA